MDDDLEVDDPQGNMAAEQSAYQEQLRGGPDRDHQGCGAVLSVLDCRVRGVCRCRFS